ncbi:MAG: DEAD/DEAH box helicase [Turicibacter sp.]|nr:DEAD/DEAH box helicase [Turicibacter sp.]
MPQLTEQNLHPYQKACVEHIINHKYCGLFLDMGLGKTVSTLTAINYLLFDYLDVNSVLVIAPKRVVSTVWEQEAMKWDHLKHLTFSKIVGNPSQRIAALKAKANIYLISRDNIAWLCSLFGGGKLPFDMVVSDELSSFKSYKSIRFKALRASRLYFKRFVGLTGTPAPNGLIDLWSQIYLMDRGDRLEKTISRYREKYFKPTKTNGHVVFSYGLLTDSEEQIHKKIEDICISMKAEDYLNMPERIINNIMLSMPNDLKESYIKFEKEKVLELINTTEIVKEEDENGNIIEVEKPKEVNAINAGALSNKLLQFANGAMYDENQEVHPIHDIKLEALKEIIDDANGQPVLVAWTYRFDRDRIMNYLKSYKPRELKDDKDINDWNNGKIQVLLAHPASAGHGLNLQAGGSIIVWYGQTWSLELYQQFNGRLYRQGQKNCVVINHLVMKGTHDEDVIEALKNKDEKQNALMDSIKAKIEKYKKY